MSFQAHWASQFSLTWQLKRSKKLYTLGIERKIMISQQGITLGILILHAYNCTWNNCFKCGFITIFFYLLSSVSGSCGDIYLQRDKREGDRNKVQLKRKRHGEYRGWCFQIVDLIALNAVFTTEEWHCQRTVPNHSTAWIPTNRCARSLGLCNSPGGGVMLQTVQQAHVFRFTLLVLPKPPCM